MEPAEFISRSFTTAWTNTPNMTGINPPSNKFQQAKNTPNILPQTILPDSSKLGFAPVGLIQSKREPYAVEHYYTKYGQLETRLGTSLGK